MLSRIIVSTLALITGVTTSSAGQSLADVARAEQARRASVKTTAKVYTNESLGAAGEAPATAPATSAPATPKAGEAAAAPAPKPADKPGTAEPVKDEKYWRERVTSARNALQRSQTFAAALESQINALYTEFVNMSDPAQRTIVEQKRLAAIAEQDRVKADIVNQTKAVAAIEDEARRANVPSGWIR